MLDVSLVMRKLIKFLSFVFFFFFTFALKATLECIHNTQYVAWNFILVFSILCSVTILIPFSMPNEWICFQFRNSTKTTKKNWLQYYIQAVTHTEIELTHIHDYIIHSEFFVTSRDDFVRKIHFSSKLEREGEREQAKESEPIRI